MNLKNKKYVIPICVILGLILFFASVYCLFFRENDKAIILYDTFSSYDSWKIYDYEKDQHGNFVSTVSLSETAFDGNSSVLIENKELNDTRIHKKVNVIPNSYYKVSVMTNALADESEGNGASISAMDCLEFNSIKDTYGKWEELALYIKTAPDQNEIDLSLGLGGYSNVSKGYAYFDNLIVEKISNLPNDVSAVTFTNWRESEKVENNNFVKKYSKVIFGIFMLLVLGIALIVSMKSKGSVENNDKKLEKKDYIIISILTLICAVFSFYKLGNNFAASSYWKSGEIGENIVVEFNKETNVRAMAHYGNIPNNGYYMISYISENGEPYYVPAFTLGEDIEEESNDRKPKGSFFFWNFNYGIDFFAKEIKIETVKPGWEINELAFFTINDKGEYEIIPVTIKSYYSTDKSVGTPDMLFDEQHLVPESSTYMNSTYFDEVYFPRTAYEQLNGLDIYEITHPPLGKIIISIGITLFGMNPFGWRIMGTIFGILLVPLMYLFAFKIFKNSKYAFIASFLMMFDFMRMTQTRLATIDSYSTFFIICMYYFMYDYFINRDRNKTLFTSLKPLFLSGLMFGFGAATKWSCLYAGGGLAFIFFLTKLLEFIDVKKEKSKLKEWITRDFIPTCLYCVLFFVIIPLIIYTLSYIPYLPSNPDKGLIDIVIDNQKYIFNYHSQLVDTHPFQSEWYTWPLNIRPIWLYDNNVLPEGLYSTIASFGNPAIWCISLIAIFLSIFLMWNHKDKKGTILLLGYAFQYFPWILVTRISFIYSYFTALPFAILLLVYCISKFDNGKKISNIVIGVYLLIVLILFIMFFPVLTGMIVDKNYVEWLKWLPTWYF